MRGCIHMGMCQRVASCGRICLHDVSTDAARIYKRGCGCSAGPFEYTDLQACMKGVHRQQGFSLLWHNTNTGAFTCWRVNLWPHMLAWHCYERGTSTCTHVVGALMAPLHATS